MEQTDKARVTALVTDFFGGTVPPFRPCAYFDEPLDCIRVIARDCSISEIRVNPILTILEDNYTASQGRDLYVGFTIKGARHFCQERGIDLSVPVKVSELLDQILQTYSGNDVRFAVNAVAKPLVARDENMREVLLPAA